MTRPRRLFLALLAAFAAFAPLHSPAAELQEVTYLLHAAGTLPAFGPWVNDLFEGDLTPGDKLVYVNDVIKGKLTESEKLAEQAMNNTKQQFANSPDLASEILGAVIDALSALSGVSKQALQSEKLRQDMRDVLLGAGNLWEDLRDRTAHQRPVP